MHPSYRTWTLDLGLSPSVIAAAFPLITGLLVTGNFQLTAALAGFFSVEKREKGLQFKLNSIPLLVTPSLTDHVGRNDGVERITTTLTIQTSCRITGLWLLLLNPTLAVLLSTLIIEM